MKKSCLVAFLFALLTSNTALFAHCQVPCGIYADDNVLDKLMTDFSTIEKAAKQISELSQDPATNAHQLTRWISNKESHAQAIQSTVTDYFLAQRLKLAEAEENKESYLKKLATCHKVIVAAMKCKQSTDMKAIASLQAELSILKKLFGTQ